MGPKTVTEAFSSQGAILWLTLGIGLLAGGGCARTELRGGYPCPVEGAREACVDDCGSGEAVCEEGFWSRCRVPKVVEACRNECGDGERICADSRWSECRVERVERACENICGAGLEVCEENVWSACEVPPAQLECSSKCGAGEQTCENNALSACSAPQPLPPVFSAIVRDFQVSHPDFEEEAVGLDLGIVEEELGPDEKPVFRGGTTVTTAENFDQWFRDVPGVNLTRILELPLEVSPSDSRLYVFRNPDFFPIDGELFGNEGNEHNYHFTLEASASFVYQGGESFSFTGDDDLFVFVNRRLVIDLGGLHESISGSVNLDEVAASIGLELGGEYPLHIFFAERHTVASNFTIETSIAGLGECP